MAQRNHGNPWGQGSQAGGKKPKSAKKNSPVSPPPPVKSAEERFRQAQAKLQESVKKHLDQELELSSEEEDLETDDIYDSVIRNYSQIGGKNEDLGKTQNFLENIFRSDVAICLICIATIKRADKIWSCGSCYGFFHLLCIQRWGKDSIAHQKLAEDERLSPTKREYHWPCPKCRKSYNPDSIPQRYECFCRQVIDPPFQPWLVPHSCGQVCGKDLVPSCGHTCLLLCHPGPCPPCPKMVKTKCYCSNGGEKMVRCCHKEWSCGQKCSKKLACEKHKCEAVCHTGDCPACPKTSMISCDCKSQSRMTACAEISWKCGKVCGKPLDCGKHTCELVCHKDDCGPCPLTLPRSCPCGAEEAVLPCTQEVATCGSTCGKLLDCGLHTCNQRCHRGSCGACMEFLEKFCRCGSHKKEIACIKEYLCETKCKGMRDCGVHPCNRKCCDGRCPPCEKICAKTLRCGQHKCTSVCHRGPCYPCEQTKQISCRCGSTVITVPCGTHKKKKNLKCNKLCMIPPDCHHEKREEHKCHMGQCPPCRQTCSKPRDCGHPCSLSCHSSVVVSAVPNYKPATPWDRVDVSKDSRMFECPKCEFCSPEMLRWPSHVGDATPMVERLNQELLEPLENEEDSSTSSVEAERHIDGAVLETSFTMAPLDQRDTGEPKPSQEEQQSARVKLSGSRKKRYLHFMQRGLSHEEAYKASETKMTENIPERKGQRSSTGTAKSLKVGEATPHEVAQRPPTKEGHRPSSKGGQKPPNEGWKLPPTIEAQPAYMGRMPTTSTGVGSPGPSSGDALLGVKVGIVNKNYPATLLSVQQLDIIQERILDLIVEEALEADPPPPVERTFEGMSYRSGWIRFHCTNRSTADWLQGAVDSGRLLEGTPLLLIKGNELPRKRVAVGCFPDSATVTEERILLLLGMMNQCLRTRHWRVLHRVNKGTQAQLTMLVDDASAAAIEVDPRVFYRFGTMQLRLKKETKSSPMKEGGIDEPAGKELGSTSAQKRLLQQQLQEGNSTASTTGANSNEPQYGSSATEQQQENGEGSGTTDSNTAPNTGEASPEDQQAARAKMCGSRYKRYLHFRRKGFSDEEAYKASESKMTEIVPERKRQRSTRPKR